ncbi:MAG: malate synthase A [Bernardetiaceae bacterium]|nr:malate synthase A [Bernardetiaceae bacterium]
MNSHTTTAIEGVVLKTEKLSEAYAEILSDEALQFVAALHRKFDATRHELLKAREAVQAQIQKGIMPTFPKETAHIRDNKEWKVAPIPADLQNRKVEITGPVERKMMINALNSGAQVFMGDFEDANSPTWANCIEGQINCRDANRRQIDFYDPKKDKHYKLNDEPAVLLVRPRGWHLDEAHVEIDGKPVSASLFDFGLYFFHNAQTLLERNSAPYFYLAKLENHKEAALWNDVFVFAQDYLKVPQGSIKVTVLLETILASFEIEEILYALRNHIAGINAGRWDYIFSAIKKFRSVMATPFPDRGQITMTVPFMRAYTELLVKSCHKRGAHAIGGMSAFIPSKDEQANATAFEKVTKDKEREANDGFDGSWVAHPALVPVAKAVFDKKFGDKPHQKERLREEVAITEKDLLNFDIEGGVVSEAGIRQNFNVGMRYINAWLEGIGAAALFNLMEDAATAEISRSQLWQWLHNKAQTKEGKTVTVAYYEQIIKEEVEKIKAEFGEAQFAKSQFANAEKLMRELVFDANFEDFLTLKAYPYIC